MHSCKVGVSQLLSDNRSDTTHTHTFGLLSFHSGHLKGHLLNTMDDKNNMDQFQNSKLKLKIGFSNSCCPGFQVTLLIALLVVDCLPSLQPLLHYNIIIYN